jgi:hypothetical protein
MRVHKSTVNFNFPKKKRIHGSREKKLNPAKPNATPHQQGRSTFARFFAKKHQSDPIVQWENQNQGQADKVLNKSTMQKSGTPHDTLHKIHRTKHTVVAVPKANEQMPEILAPTVRHNPQDRAFLQQETDIEDQITEQKQPGSISATNRKMIQMETDAPTDPAQTWRKYPSDLLEAVPQNAINDIPTKDIIDTDSNERKEDRQDFNQIQPDTTKPENTSYAKDFPPLHTSYSKDFPPLQDGTTSTPLSAQSPPTIVEVKYAPSLPDQINFHLTRRIWCETA